MKENLYFIQFRTAGKVLNIINYHAITHDETFPERAEIVAITRWIQNQNLPNLIWAGDFNLEVKDIGFDNLKAIGFTNCLNGQKLLSNKVVKTDNTSAVLRIIYITDVTTLTSSSPKS
ncbi:MAG: hypothetical protein IPN10_16675 [Saprospiraceae bacterium]|nr:hypothetical protein [Saprospiraceae bacterium]